MPESNNPSQYAHLYGLIGYPLGHSFSKKYFSQKFAEQKLDNHFYELFPLETIEALPALLRRYPQLKGLNVTIPYKEKVLAYLDEVDPAAESVAAVNTIKIEAGKLIGYNTDVYGFGTSLRHFLQENDLRPNAALVLGTGGASKAICYELAQMQVEVKRISRSAEKGDWTYEQLTEVAIRDYPLIINTTPLGTFPDIAAFPKIPYQFLGDENVLFDLVYNPEKTVFLIKGKQQGSFILNGLEMLRLQAEKAWQIWNA